MKRVLCNVFYDRITIFDPITKNTIPMGYIVTSKDGNKFFKEIDTENQIQFTKQRNEAFYWSRLGDALTIIQFLRYRRPQETFTFETEYRKRQPIAKKRNKKRK